MLSSFLPEQRIEKEELPRGMGRVHRGFQFVLILTSQLTDIKGDAHDNASTT